jgi:hypothetical protein
VRFGGLVVADEVAVAEELERLDLAGSLVVIRVSRGDAGARMNAVDDEAAMANSKAGSLYFAILFRPPPRDLWKQFTDAILIDGRFGCGFLISSCAASSGCMSEIMSQH